MIKVCFADRKACPNIYCDHCFEMIGDHVEGTALFYDHWNKVSTDPQHRFVSSPVWHLHSETCLREFRVAVEGYARGIKLDTQALGVHLYFICHNTEITPAMFKQLGSCGEK